jgi:dolichyl-phosphate-mannose--protein O-mannosyl transferase
LVHVNSTQALKFSGKQLPEWGFNQHEVVTDRVILQEDTIWNVEEHRYTTSELLGLAEIVEVFTQLNVQVMIKRSESGTWCMPK